MTGMQFCEFLESFISREGPKYQVKAKEIEGASPKFRGFHKIARNAAKSKHLETMTTTIFGLDLDFVNLRKEVYEEGSRVPKEMGFGSAKEDAFRKDATVNALFYNLDSGQIEDFTGMGLRDMEAGVVRTPLEPRRTFLDDSLRVLRVIRIVSRHGFSIEDRTKEAMKDTRIHEMLRMIISRERVGIEVTKMMNGPDPLVAFQLIHELNLFPSVFLDETSYQSRRILAGLLPGQNSDITAAPWPSTWPHAYETLSTILQQQNTVVSTSNLKNLLQHTSPDPSDV